MNSTYSLRVVLKFLNENDFQYIFNSYKNENNLENGVHVMINHEIAMSIQTHSSIAGSDFSEIVVFETNTKKLISGPKRFSPKDLFYYLNEIRYY